MKPIIMDMREISDSTEAYAAKPHKIFVIFIYTILGMLAVALIWAYFWKLDIVVKSNGIFKIQDSANVISVETGGRVVAVYMQEGIYVNEGDTLLTIDHEKEDEQLEIYTEMLSETEERLSMLEGYQDYLDDKIQELEAFKENRFYQEYAARAGIITANKDAGERTKDNQIMQYEQNIKSTEESIAYYQNQKEEYSQAVRCIKEKNNTFSEEDTYYYSLIDSYLMSCKTINEKYADSDGNITEDGKKALNSLEMEQITALQQQIATVEGTLLTLKGNLDTAETQLAVTKNGTEGYTKETTVLTEKNAVSTELSGYEAKKKEYEENIKSIESSIKKCEIQAQSSGYVSILTQTEAGQYIQSGTGICEIIPKGTNSYYAEVYVSNQDMGMIAEGQKVKLEIAAYPSSEYGMLEGVIDTVSKDIKADNSTGSAYYLVRVRCDKTELYNKEGKAVTVINGMACQAKIITDEQSVLRYVLDKIDLID